MTREGDASASVKGDPEVVEAEIMPSSSRLEVQLQGESVLLPAIELAEDPRARHFTIESQLLILRGILDGLSLEKAAALAGVARRTVGLWRDKGEDDPDGAYAAFSKALSQVEAAFQIKTLSEARSAANDKNSCWTFWVTMLERRFPSEFGRSDKRLHEHDHRLTGGLEQKVLEFQRKRLEGGDSGKSERTRVTGD